MIEREDGSGRERERCVAGKNKDEEKPSSPHWKPSYRKLIMHPLQVKSIYQAFVRTVVALNGQLRTLPAHKFITM